MSQTILPHWQKGCNLLQSSIARRPLRAEAILPALFGARTLADLVEELQIVRASTVYFAKHLDSDVLARRGVANGQPVSVRALLYIIAGHERHHVALLRERYLKQ